MGLHYERGLYVYRCARSVTAVKQLHYYMHKF